MSQDQEWIVRLQFLEEAQEYLDAIESSLIGLGNGPTASQLDSALRATHSIKGGSAMMGFEELSHVGHRMEDFFKVLKAGNRAEQVNGGLEQLFLSGCDRMRQMTEHYRQRSPIDGAWLDAHIRPILDQLYDALGDPAAEDELAVLSAEAGEDMRVMMFEGEVGPCLDRLEGVLEHPELPLLRQELKIASQELAGLGEMLDLGNFARLCHQVSDVITAVADSQLEAIAGEIIQTLRRSHALVLIGQFESMPEALEISLAAAPQAHDGAAQLNQMPPTTEQANSEQLTVEAEDIGASAFNLSLAAIDDLFTHDSENAAHTMAAFLSEGLGDSLGEIRGEEAVAEASLASPESNADEAIEAMESSSINDATTLDSAPEAVSEVVNAADTEVASTSDIDLEISTVIPEETGLDSDALAALWNDDSFQQDIAGSEIFASPLLAPPEPTTASSQDPIANTEMVAPAPLPDEAETSSNPQNPSKTHHPSPTTASKQEASLRVPTQQIERLSELFGELNTERNGLNLQLKHMRSLVTLLSRRVKALNQANQQLRQSYDRVATQIPTIHPAAHQPAAPSPGTISPSTTSAKESASSHIQLAANISQTEHLSHRFDALEMDHYSDFHLLSQELIESVVQIQEVTNDLETALGDTEGSSREISRTSQQMQVSMTQVRMRPLTEVTNRFPRVLRELSISHSKDVALTVYGGSTLIERDILEALQDPLMHLLRNCFDHGLETSSDRLAQGKSAQGNITIRSGYRGNQVFITVQDDGAGINLDKIRAKVHKMGLTEADIAASGEQALLNMIFEPGFSTAEHVTNLSGRGVGMDVVRTNLEAIRGTIQVETAPGQGTTFTITVPLSLSVTRVLVVESHGMLMAFPANIVEEMQLLNEVEIQTAANQEMIQWQGYTVPLIRLKAWMKFARSPMKPETENTPVIDQQAMLIVSQGQEPYALQCDRYWGEQEVTTRTVEGNVSLPPGFSGCVVLGDGRVVPLVDIEPLLSWILQGGPLAKLATTPMVMAGDETEQQTVMIIDDSITVRRFLAITLEKAGYRVEQAKDGQDALEKLKGGIQPHTMICDIEMPRLDGFGFLGQVKSLPTHKHIPVMMLTSRSGDKHRKLAMSLGATAYFSKPFKKQELLKQLEEFSSHTQPNLALA